MIGVINKTARMAVVDTVARLVDRNLSGRSDMCMQFADLLHRALRHLHLPARAVLGKCIYYLDSREIFRWDHAWVRVGYEVIDGNVDILSEILGAFDRNRASLLGPHHRGPRRSKIARINERSFPRHGR